MSHGMCVCVCGVRGWVYISVYFTTNISVSSPKVYITFVPTLSLLPQLGSRRQATTFVPVCPVY